MNVERHAHTEAVFIQSYYRILQVIMRAIYWPALFECAGGMLHVFVHSHYTEFCKLCKRQHDLHCLTVQGAYCTCMTSHWRALNGWWRTWRTVLTATCVWTVSSTSNFTSSKTRPQILVSVYIGYRYLGKLIGFEYSTAARFQIQKVDSRQAGKHGTTQDTSSNRLQASSFVNQLLTNAFKNAPAG